MKCFYCKSTKIIQDKYNKMNKQIPKDFIVYKCLKCRMFFSKHKTNID